MGDMRTFLLAMRQAMLIALGALEDYLGIPRSIVPKHARREAERDGVSGQY